MSSEKYELASDELSALLESLEADLGGLERAQGEQRKRILQVIPDWFSHWCILPRHVPAGWRREQRLWRRWRERPGLLHYR